MSFMYGSRLVIMNKRVITIFALIFGGLGSYMPILLGWDPTGLNGLSILGGLVGGIVGIWLGVVISQKYG